MYKLLLGAAFISVKKLEFVTMLIFVVAIIQWIIKTERMKLITDK